MCDKSYKSFSCLEKHCCQHFLQELEEKFSSWLDGSKCKICYSVFHDRNRFLLHIGGKHGKVNDILKEKGYPLLPCSVGNTYSSVMQKQLEQMKTERSEAGAFTVSSERTRRELYAETIREEIPDNNSLRNPNPSPNNDPKALPSMQDIINKYLKT